jgi:hypothetical protein
MRITELVNFSEYNGAPAGGFIFAVAVRGYLAWRAASFIAM